MKYSIYFKVGLVIIVVALLVYTVTMYNRFYGSDTMGVVEFSHAQQMCLSFDGLMMVTTRSRATDSVLIEARCSNETLVVKRVSL
jgi:hypothetical protein